MKSIVIITSNYAPETNAAAQRITAVAEAMAAAGWRVRVVAPLPHYPQYEIYAGYDGRSPLISEENGVEVVRIRPWIVPRTSLPARLLAETAFDALALRHVLSCPADLFVASSPYMFNALVGLLASRLRRKPFLWDVRDLTWLYTRATGKRTFGLEALMDGLMRGVAARADGLTTVTQGILDYFVTKPALASVFPNGVSDEWLARLLEVPPPRPASRPKVVYAGLLGMNQGLSTLVEAAALLPEADFVIAGDGPERAALAELARARGARNVELTGYLSRHELLGLYAQADVFVAHLRRHQVYEWAQPTKVWEYMAAGRPVIYAGEGEMARIVSENDIGVIVPPEDPERLAQAARELLASPEQMRLLAGRGRRYVVENRTRSRLVAAFVSMATRLVESRTEAPR